MELFYYNSEEADNSNKGRHAIFKETADYLQGNDEDQELTIREYEVPHGNYYTIETKRLAVDSVDELIDLFEQFKLKE